MSLDNIYMQRAIDLAQIARGRTEPNPLVGAVIVADGRIIGEGYHHRAGQRHAEIVALDSVSKKDESLIAGSTIYVNLEPCSHYGKTPPCAERLIKERLGRVVIAMQDPFPDVSGNGIRMLREANIQVDVGLLAKEAARLNEVFFTVQRLHRPFITLKWAESADGFIDRERTSRTDPPIIFSTALRQRAVHRLRGLHRAILVGGRTALLDDPSLNTRHWDAPNPLRVIWSNSKPLPHDLKIFDGNPSLIALPSNTAQDYLQWLHNAPNVDVLLLDTDKQAITQILSALLDRNIHSLLVEGGSNVLEQFIQGGFYDQIDREQSRLVLSSGVAAPELPD